MPTDPAAAADDVTGLGFAQASAELDRILRELEQDAVDVDVLAARVARAAALIRHCRGRIADARVTVEAVVAELDRSAGGVEADEP